MKKLKNIAIGCDHAGFSHKKAVTGFLSDKGFNIIDFGTNSDQSVDYPDHVHPLAESIENGQAELGILMCGSANGVAITANKHKEIRAALCWEKEIAELARRHNNANVICIPARFVSEEEAINMIDIFLNTEFEGGRHQNRVDKISK